MRAWKRHVRNTIAKWAIQRLAIGGRNPVPAMIMGFWRPQQRYFHDRGNLFAHTVNRLTR
jgi:hypothetical protein